METARYRAFLTVAEVGSIKKAADVMGYTSSAVSQLIHALEKELNLTLFLRGKRGMQLTSSGEMLIPAVTKLVSQENTIIQLADNLNGMISGRINIASYHSLSSAWMPDLVSAFQNEYPKVRINIYEGTQRDIMERLANGRADLAFFNNSAMTGTYDWIPLREDPMMAVIPVDHKMADAKSFPVKMFKGERFIMPEHGFDYDVLSVLGKANVTPDVYLSTFDSNILLEMVEKGLGVSMINGISIKEEDKSRNVRILPLEPPQSIEMGIAVMSLNEAATAVKKFINMAVRIIADK